MKKTWYALLKEWREAYGTARAPQVDEATRSKAKALAGRLWRDLRDMMEEA